MLTRRRILSGAAIVVVGVIFVVIATRPDGGGRESVDAIDRTTSTTRRSSTSTSTSTTAGSSTTADPAASSTTSGPAGTGPSGSHGTAATRPAGPTSTAAPPTTRASGFAVARIRLTSVANLGYPIALAVWPGDGGLWVATKSGSVCRLPGCTSSQVVASVSNGGEQGLLGITFNHGGTRFYASYTNPAGDTRVDEFVVGGGGVPNLGTRREIFAEDQPEANHNGGNVLFGPDGRLYLGLGDGGGAGDQHGTIGNAQDPNTDLGKILRIDPTATPPVVERWISGVRNPWRFSFDRANGDLWIGDVGQGSWEEIDYLPAGAQQGRNLGWRCFEGSHVYSACGGGGFTGPIFEYSHSEGCSITGGYLYRGSRIPDLVGAYLFADYCDGELRALTHFGGQVTAQRRLGVDPGNVVSFGQDGAGELYVLTPSAIFRVDPA